METKDKFSDLMAQAAGLVKSEDWRQALYVLDECLMLRPGDTKILYNKGLVHAKLGQTGEAIACMQKVVMLDPADRMAEAALQHLTATTESATVAVQTPPGPVPLPTPPPLPQPVLQPSAVALAPAPMDGAPVGGKASAVTAQQPSRTFCRKCGQAIEPEAQFCGSCGTAQSATHADVDAPTTPTNASSRAGAACPQCRAPLGPKATFCPRCGLRVRAGGAEPPQATGSELWGALGTFIKNPVGNIGDAYDAISGNRAFSGALLFTGFYAACIILAMILVAGKLGAAASAIPSDIYLKLALLTAVQVATLAAPLFGASRIGRSDTPFAASVFVAAGSLIPFGLFIVLSALLASENSSMLTLILLVAALCITVLVLFSGGTKILEMSDGLASIAVPASIMVSAWLCIEIAKAMLGSSVPGMSGSQSPFDLPFPMR